MNTESVSETVPNGGVWASILAAGVGCAALGVVIDLCEGWKWISNALNFYKPTGDLSGKTTVAVGIWLIAWAILHARWRERRVESPRAILRVTVILVVVALIAVFPPVFALLAAR